MYRAVNSFAGSRRISSIFQYKSKTGGDKIFPHSFLRRHRRLQPRASTPLRTFQSPIFQSFFRATLPLATMGKKAPSKTAVAKAGTAAPKTSVAAVKAPAEEESSFQTGDWAKSLVSDKDINELNGQGLLDGMEYQLPGDEEIPNPPEGWRVMFLSFLFRGLSLPAHEFLRGLLFVYGVQIWQLTPKAILHVAVFVNFCECYLGLPHTLASGKHCIRCVPTRKATARRYTPLAGAASLFEVAKTPSGT